jgi:hypothetical protein
MTPAKMFDGDLWMLASDAVAMAENAYKKGQTDEREECAKVCDEMEQKAEGTECCKWPTPADCAHTIRARGKE